MGGSRPQDAQPDTGALTSQLSLFEGTIYKPWAGGRLTHEGGSTLGAHQSQVLRLPSSRSRWHFSGSDSFKACWRELREELEAGGAVLLCAISLGAALET